MRILVYRLGSMGDTVLALPCFHLIRDKFPDAHITVLTNSPVSGKAAALESILGPTNLINNVIPYPVGLRAPRELAALHHRLRKEKFDLLICLTAARGWLTSVRDLLFFRSCGIPRIVGIPFRHDDLVCVREAPGALFELEAKRLLRRIESIGSVDLAKPQRRNLCLTVQEQTEGESILQSGMNVAFIAASLGTKSPLNDWGFARWAELLARISAKHPSLGLILFGSGDEFARSEEIQAGWRGSVLNLCGRTSPRVSAAVLSKARLFLGHDSGPMHLAAAAGTCCVAIFSARCPPGQWFPLGVGHRPLYPLGYFDPKKSTDLDYQQAALASIRVDDVLTAMESVGNFAEFQTK